MNENNSNDLQTIITQVIEEMKSEQGHKFDLNKINLAELERRTGMTSISHDKYLNVSVRMLFRECSCKVSWKKSVP